MTLDGYLEHTGLTAKDFAERIGLTEASVSRIRKGRQNLSRDVMRRIIAATGGLVSAEALVLHEQADIASREDPSCGNAVDLPASPAEAA